MSTFCDINKTINEIKSSLNGKKLALFLDFDGTLAEIQTIPDNTYMTKDMSNVMKDISYLKDVLTVAISGRKIEDLQRRVGLKDIVYSGNHGLELCLDGGEVTYCLDDGQIQLLRTGIRNVIKDLSAKKLGKECGGNIEDKDTCLTWHFFNAPTNQVESIVKQACNVVQNQGFPIFDGVGCIEVRHPDITKGDAMKRILYQKVGPNWHETHHAIFIGDSSSDEDGYLALRDDPEFKHEHMTYIRILFDLKKTTSGKYVFRGCDDVYSLLSALNDYYYRNQCMPHRQMTPKVADFCDMKTAISEIKASLKGKKLALFLDYDGTLAEIDEIPDNTCITKEMSQVLTELSCMKNVLMAAISGRQIDDLKARIGLKDIVYSGNFGLEMDLYGTEVTHSLDDEKIEYLRSGIKNIIKNLKERNLGKERGGNIENKDTAMTWHYFNVAPEEVDSALEEACSIVRNEGLPIYEGVGCIEVRHPSITKGDAMKEILYQKIGPNWHQTHHLIFIGDSTSDEDGYLDLCGDPDFKDEHVSFIRILTDLRKKTTGRFIFRGVDDVYSLLTALKDHYNHHQYLPQQVATRKMSLFCDMKSAINEIKSCLKGKKLALFLDFDGTLAEIQSIPDNTYMTKDMSQVLGNISRLDDDILLVAISGRKIEDLQRRVGLKDIVYSGNHGLELCLDGGEVTYCLDDEKLQLLRTGIRKVIRDLNARKLGKECGGNIEDKDTAMTWHFFNVAPNEASSIVKQACTLVENRGFPVFDGVGCIEVRHPSITKGDAMKEILYQKLGANWHETHHAIFIGDSSSDEDGYLALRDDPEFEHDHVTFIRILTDLKKTTTGKYVFRGCDDVYSLLDALNDFYSLRKSVF